MDRNQYKKTQSDFIKTLVGTNLSWIEEAIVICALRIPDFWRAQCKDRINKQTKGFAYQDFTCTTHHILYDIANSYYSSFYDSGPLTVEITLNMLASEFNEDKFTQEDFRASLKLVNEVWAHDLSKFESFIYDAVPHWLNRRRTEQIASRVPTSKSLVAKDLMDRLRDVEMDTTASERQEIPTFAQYLENVQNKTEKPKICYPLSSLGRFNSFLGGGLVPGELGLLIIPSSGGKTVMANQMCSDLTLSEVNTILVPTEQSYDQMYTRQVSAICDIPFSKVNRGLDVDTLSGGDMEKIKAYQERVSPYLRIEDLSLNPTNLLTDLDNILHRYTDEGFKPQVLILDWLGCGMTHMDSGERSNFMSGATKSLRDQCKKHDCAIVIFAQGHPKETLNKPYVQATDATGCKTLHVYADWGCGVSLLTETTSESGSSEHGTRKTQNANFFKTRHAPPGTMKLDRDFAYQRWKVTEDAVLSSTTQLGPR